MIWHVLISTSNLIYYLVILLENPFLQPSKNVDDHGHDAEGVGCRELHEQPYGARCGRARGPRRGSQRCIARSGKLVRANLIGQT